MAKFKVGNRVKTHGNYSFDPGLGVVVKTDGDDLYYVDVEGEEGPGIDPGWAYNGRHLAAVAGATAALTIEAGKFYKTRDGRKVGPVYRGWEDNEHWPFKSTSHKGMYYKKDGFSCPGNAHDHKDDDDLVAEWIDEPTPIAETIGIDLTPPAPPQVGDDVLIFGTIAGINHSPRGTNYNIVFETQNRRMSLHFLEEDFIVVDDEDGGCQCDNDNGPAPSTDTAKAFDAMGAWLRSLAVSRAA